MPAVFLTGGTGFVGAHVARALAARGWSVRALARRTPSAGSPLADGAVELVRGDLGDTAALARGAAGCAAIVHAAGVVKARTFEEYREANARGTDRLLAAARERAGDAVFVFVSSQAAAGPAMDGRPVAEGDPPRPVSWYGRSKLEAEVAVERGWRGPWIVLRPAVVYGPGDRGLLALFRAAARGWVPVPAPASRIQVIEARRAAEGIARAAESPGLTRRTGFLCDPLPVRIRDLASLLAELSPRRARLVPLPALAVRAAGAAETVLEAVTRRSHPFNADKAREVLAGDWLCDGQPIERDLDLFPPVPLIEGLRRTWDWYRRAGWLLL